VGLCLDVIHYRPKRLHDGGILPSFLFQEVEKSILFVMLNLPDADIHLSSDLSLSYSLVSLGLL